MKICCNNLVILKILKIRIYLKIYIYNLLMLYNIQYVIQYIIYNIY